MVTKIDELVEQKFMQEINENAKIRRGFRSPFCDVKCSKGKHNAQQRRQKLKEIDKIFSYLRAVFMLKRIEQFHPKDYIQRNKPGKNVVDNHWTIK